MYNLIEYSDNYLKISGGLWQYYRDEQGETDNGVITVSKSFKSKIKITGKSPTAGNTKDIEIVVQLKYLRTFWRILEMLLINCELHY